MASKSDKNGDGEGSSGSSTEAVAEWVVKAKLKISQPKKKAASFGTGDCGARRSTGSPCRVVYKWNSEPKNHDRPTETRRNAKISSEKVRVGSLTQFCSRNGKLISRHQKVDQSRQRNRLRAAMIRPLRAPAALC